MDVTNQEKEKRKIKVVFSNVKGNEPPKVLTIKDDLKTYYSLLGCNCIDIVRRKIGNKLFCFVVDDVSLLKDHPLLSSWNLEEACANLYDNLVITGLEDDEGDLTSLSSSDINLIFSRFVSVLSDKRKCDYKLLIQG